MTSGDRGKATTGWNRVATDSVPRVFKENQEVQSMGITPIEKHTRGRSLTKGLTWRFLATSCTLLISWGMTGNITTALQIGPLDFIIKLFVYYLHERLWLLPAAQKISGFKFYKMCTWKLTALSLTIAATYIVTNQLAIAIKVGPLDFFIKLFLFYLHEVIWDNIQWGRNVVLINKSKSN